MNQNSIRRLDAAPLPPVAPVDAHKGMMGHVLCVCGSPEMPGAAQLVLRAAQRGGAGLVTLAVMQTELFDRVAPSTPEAIYLDCSRTKDLYAGRLPREIADYSCHVRVAGPGMSSSGRTRELVRRLVEDEFTGPLVLDADALNVMAGIPEILTMSQSQVVLTPHPGEAQRLLEREIPRDQDGRVECAVDLAQRSGSICVLKGHGTVVTDGEQVYVNPTGGPALATAGSGDVLAGLLGAYLAWSVCCDDNSFGMFEACASAVYLHGLAGDFAARDLGTRGTVASDLIWYLPKAQCSLESSESSS